MKKMMRTKAQDAIHAQGFAAGMAVAAAIASGTMGDDVTAQEILGAGGLTSRAKAKRMGADDYDLNILKPVFAHMRATR